MGQRTFIEAVKHRRSYYAINHQSPLSAEQIEQLINDAVLYLPSAFNSQSARVVLLLGKHHARLWEIVKDTLRKIVPPAAFGKTEAKINGSFASGHGTILFYEEQLIVEEMQKAFPTYADNFPVWSQHTSAIHQFTIWTMLEDAGLGASLQHYNPLIDAQVAQEFMIPDTWKLIAQMPFGVPVAEPGPKEFESLAKRVKIFK
ncbi:MAG: nitroreductase family protein [Prevotellaceae bacterium]|jgi:predicted oxidoreductase (fatty acid repression mutant protein)|nr:nitroreductase family protein [Prevotellaceae bacterium]